MLDWLGWWRMMAPREPFNLTHAPEAACVFPQAAA
jgi:hypothetical protein